MDLARDLKGQVQRADGGGSIHERLLLFAHAFHEVLQFELERLLLQDRHRLAHNFFARELADDGRVFGVQEFLEQ